MFKEIIMEPYEGGEPYLFVSYSHADRAEVEGYIKLLQKRLCYLWYDKGNHAGDDWAEMIAEHLVKAHTVLLFISKNSVLSTNVNNELTMALNYKKRIVPVYIDDVKIPLGWEIKISHIHAVEMISEESKKDAEKLIREIPAEVFKKHGSPFYKNDAHSFYFLCEDIKDDFTGKLSIVCETEGKSEIIWNYTTPGPYEICACVNRNETDENGKNPVLVNVHGQVVDDFFDMKGNGCVIFSVRASLYLPYPLNGPEGDGIIIFALINPMGAHPSVKVLDSMTSYESSTSYDGKVSPGYEYDPVVAPPEEYKRIMHILPKE